MVRHIGRTGAASASRFPVYPYHKRRWHTFPRNGCIVWETSGAPCLACRAVAESPVSRAGPREDDDPADFGSNAFNRLHGVMMQGFGWDSSDAGGWYKILKGQLHDIKDMGVTVLWLPPPSASVSPQGYMPGQLYDFNTPFGSEDELRSLLADAKDADIATLADIVINHRCADERDENGTWNIFTDKVEHPGRSVAWGKWAIVGGDGYGGQGGEDTGADFGPAPDLDHKNPEVKESLKDWLRYLNLDLGYHGWRLDYVKGYGPDVARDYIVDTVGAGALNVGEYWTDMNWGDGGLEAYQDGARQALCDYLDRMDGAAMMFDFPTKGILQEAVRNCEYWRLRDHDNRPPGLIGWWPSRAVTFLDNHDTGSTQQHWPFPADRVMAGYAYIMTHPGMPCILHEHVFKWGLREEIQKLMALRARNEITTKSKVEILQAEHDIYIARIDGRVTIKMGPRRDMGDLLPCEGDGWKMGAKGPDFAIWEKSC